MKKDGKGVREKERQREKEKGRRWKEGIRGVGRKRDIIIKR